MSPLWESAYDPQLFRQCATWLVERLALHLEQIGSGEGKVLNWNSPESNKALAKSFLHVQSGGDFLGQFKQLVEATLSRGQNLHHPHYVGHQVPATAPIASLFDSIVSVTNQVMAIYEMGPWVTGVEHALIEEMVSLIPQTESSTSSWSGIVTHGGSMANLTGILTARNLVLGDVWQKGLSRQQGDPVLLIQADAHYCVTRAAGVLGIGVDQTIKVPLDRLRRMSPEGLRLSIKQARASNRKIVAVVASACSTPIGAFDPLDEISAICQKEGIWLHVDAAHGAAALCSRKHRHLLNGIENADSFVWDAHKMLFVPALCAFLFYRDRQSSYRAFHQDAPYLYDPLTVGQEDFDGGLRTLECTKRAAVMGLFGLWGIFGPGLFEELIDQTFSLAQFFHELLDNCPDFQPLHEPQSNIVVFRFAPEYLEKSSLEFRNQFHLVLRRRIIESGTFYLVSTTIDGETVLRCTLINPRTTPSDLSELLEEIRRQGEFLRREVPWKGNHEQPR